MSRAREEYREPARDVRYMLQVKSWGTWKNWWPDPVDAGQLEQAGGFNGVIASLREAPRPVRGPVRLVEYYQETAWVQGGVVAWLDKARAGRRSR